MTPQQAAEAAALEVAELHNEHGLNEIWLRDYTKKITAIIMRHIGSAGPSQEPPQESPVTTVAEPERKTVWLDVSDWGVCIQYQEHGNAIPITLVKIDGKWELDDRDWWEDAIAAIATLTRERDEAVERLDKLVMTKGERQAMLTLCDIKDAELERLRAIVDSLPTLWRAAKRYADAFPDETHDYTRLHNAIIDTREAAEARAKEGK